MTIDPQREGHKSSQPSASRAGSGSSAARSPDEMLCFRLTTDTGSIVELWETEHGFELLFAEAHRSAEVVHAVELRPVEVESLAGSMDWAVKAREADDGE
jgi:hypothetical protein